MTDSMESHCLSFHEIPHTTKLFSAFLEGLGKVADFYAHTPSVEGVLAAVREIRLGPEVRRQVTDTLREQNRRVSPGGELDHATERNLNRLGDGAAAIVTGQQVALFSGPAFSFYKAASALRIAEEISARGTDAVPVFWLATEDHDLAEVNRVDWSGREGILDFELPERTEDEGRRVGEVHFGDAIASVVSRAADALEGPAADNIGKALRECGEFATGFGQQIRVEVNGSGTSDLAVMREIMEAADHDAVAN